MVDHQDSLNKEENLGLAGKTAKAFIKSPLSPLFYVTMFLLGLGGLIFTPRQEDPQISVPMVDLFIQYPGAPADQVASLAIQPLERIMWEIPGVEHVYSAIERGRGMVTVQFEVGEKMEPSLVKVNDQLASNMDKIPNGVSPPLVKAKGIDDVPVVTVTLWSDKDFNGDGVPDVDDSQLRRLALSVLQSVKEIPDTGEGFVVGGRAEQVTIEVLPERLAGYGISLGQVAQAIQGANSEQQVGAIESSGSQFTVVTGKFLKTVDDINQLKVGSHNGVPVYVYDVADVRQGPEDATHMVAYYTGAAADNPDRAVSVPAVTVAIAKKEGTNGVDVANAVIARLNELKGDLIPANVEVSITRNYGKTANDKVQALIFKLFVATGFVFVLVWFAFRALKPAIVVLLVIPVVLLFTIFGAWMMGFTIDRVSLFALIFSIGILVDDAIVVVENIYRRWLEKGATDTDTAVDAVREVGNPTILATLTVIAALLPMGFVSGMMGPYMMPIPALGSVAMAISLFAAFVFTPWLATHGVFRPSMHYLENAEKREHAEAEWLEKLYRRILIPMIRNPRKASLFRLAMWGAFMLACSLFYFNIVAVKMLPLDNKPEFSVAINMQEGTALPDTANAANDIANLVRKMPEVTDVQIYVGTARPYDFNGMVRHYYLRDKPWQAEVQVQLLDKGKRHRSSHELAVAAREEIGKMFQGKKINITVVEMPPGPPVLQSVVAEVHGPDGDTRKRVASHLTEVFSKAPNLVDVDNYMREPYDYWHFIVDREKADRHGISVDIINQNLAMAMGGMTLGDVKQKAGYEPVNILIQVPLAERAQVTRLGDILIQADQGAGVPLRELGEFQRIREDDVIYHKDLRAVEYVVADVGGRLAAPVYGMLQVEGLLEQGDGGKSYITPDNTKLADETYWMGSPPTDSVSGIEWAGEWTVTYETFRDMGIAFGAALILIYILVVWEFGNFRIPALIMSPIPLTLLGIIPMHAIFFAFGWGGEFTATSMIGWIALAGIIVRNSILLVDFSIHEIQKGVSVEEAVIRACKTRTRPILITAFALIFASSVIFFDPIFQGMAISLASGVLVSTVLTLVVIPLGCVNAGASLCEVACVPPEAPGVKQTPLWLDGGRGLGKAAGKLLTILFQLLLLLFRGLFLGVQWAFKMIRQSADIQKSGSGGVGVSRTVVSAPAEPEARVESAAVMMSAGAPEVASVKEPVAEEPVVVVEVLPEQSLQEQLIQIEQQPEAKPEPLVTPVPKPVPESAAPVTAEPEVTVAPTESKPVAQPLAVKPVIQKKAAVSKKKVQKKAAAPNPPTKVKAEANKASATNSAVVAQPVIEQQQPQRADVASEPDAQPSSYSAKKVGQRRGIRLKTLAIDEDDGLS